MLKCWDRKKIWVSYLTAIVLKCWDEKRKWFSYLTAKVLKKWYENNETFSYLTAIMLNQWKKWFSYLTAIVLMDPVTTISTEMKILNGLIVWPHLHIFTKDYLSKPCIIHHLGLSLIIIKKKIGWIRDQNFFFALWWSVRDYCCHDHIIIALLYLLYQTDVCSGDRNIFTPSSYQR